MKIKLGILFISALVLASGCARKCPPCPISTGTYGASSSYTSTPMQSGSYSAPAEDTSSKYSSNASARYVSK